MHVRQVVPIEMVEKVEINITIMTTGVEKRADGDGFMWSVDGKLSDLR